MCYRVARRGDAVYFEDKLGARFEGTVEGIVYAGGRKTAVRVKLNTTGSLTTIPRGTHSSVRFFTID